MAGTGPEYSYPVTGKDEPIPVVDNEDPVVEAGGAGAEPVVGEDAPELNDKDIAGNQSFLSLDTRDLITVHFSSALMSSTQILFTGSRLCSYCYI